MTKDEALKLALDALETSMYPQQKQLQAITSIKEALANEALDKMAENARELGLDYEPAQEPVAWEGGEGWESLAWELCADENGEDSCNELIWEGGPIPEPWGDRWMKYEEEAKRLIALVQKHTTPPQRTWVGLTDEDKEEIKKQANYHWEMTTGEYAQIVQNLTEVKLKQKNEQQTQ